MRRLFVTASLALLACHTDSAVAPEQPPAGVTDAKNMSVGEVRVLTPSQVPSGIELTASAGVSDYLLVVSNTNPTLDVSANYVVKGNLLADGAARAALFPSTMVAFGDAEPDAQQVADAHIRAFERAHLRPTAAASIAIGARNSIGISPIMATTVGQQVTIKVPNESASDLCQSFFTTTGTVKWISSKAIIILDNQANQNAFSPADYTAIGNEFDNVVYPTDSAYFGKPTDIDANGHVVLYYTPEVNKLTQSGQSSFIGGFFFGGDFFSPTAQTNGCPQSNLGEIFYLLAPDPGAIFNNVRTTSSVRQGTRGTIAHEFEHMINAGNRIQFNAPTFEAVWLDEGLAHTAEDAVGRVVKGFSDFQTVTDALLFPAGTQPGSTVANDYNAFFFQNLNRFKFWAAHPDTSSPLSKRADQNLSSRGAIWSLLRWTGDQYSGGDFRGYTRKLTAGPDSGVKNLTKVAAQPLDTLLAGWMVANYADHLGIPGLAAKYNYVGYNMRSAVAGANSGPYPLAVTTLLAGSSVTTKSLSGSGTYYKVTLPAGVGRTILVQDPAGTNASFPGAHYYVLRID